jgi:hypothetical protein
MTPRNILEERRSQVKMYPRHMELDKQLADINTILLLIRDATVKLASITACSSIYRH